MVLLGLGGVWFMSRLTFLMLLLRSSSLLTLTVLLWETLLASFSLGASDRLGVSEFKSLSSASFSPTDTQTNKWNLKHFVPLQNPFSGDVDLHIEPTTRV